MNSYPYSYSEEDNQNKTEYYLFAPLIQILEGMLSIDNQLGFLVLYLNKFQEKIYINLIDMIGLADSLQFDSPRRIKEVVETISMATLNYSGLSLSPYEFYQSQNQHQKQISQTFAAFVKQKHPQFGQEGAGDKFKWTMSSLQMKWENRFAPAKRIDVGIKQDDTMMSQEEFLAQWQRIYDLNKQQIKKNYFQQRYQPEDIQKQTKIQIQSCKEYDLFCYKTLMKVYCGIGDIKGIKGVPAQAYRQIKQKQFSKPYLNEQNKLNVSITQVKNMDHEIIFFQESHANFIARLKKQIQDYHIIERKGVQSVILVNKNFCNENINFQEENNKFLQVYSKKLQTQANQTCSPKQIASRLNFNKDSVFQVVDNFILFNLHLSSKKDKNLIQLKQFRQQVQKMVTFFPNYHFVCGGDFNCTINNKLFENLEERGVHFSIAPQGFGSLSVNKKRTMMQAQRNKANLLDQSTKDYFVSTLKLIKWQVSLIDGTVVSKSQSSPLLPTSGHPYDHYIILVIYQKPK